MSLQRIELRTRLEGSGTMLTGVLLSMADVEKTRVEKAWSNNIPRSKPPKSVLMWFQCSRYCRDLYCRAEKEI